MKNVRTLTIEFEVWADFKNRVTTALRDKRSSVRHRDVLVFNTVTDYQKFMTEQKLAIIAVIINQAPSSIYQLAQLVDRDFANVQRDCVALESMGFIRLVNTGDNKKSKRPEPVFDYVRIVVKMPNISYSHEFLNAA